MRDLLVLVLRVANGVNLSKLGHFVIFISVKAKTLFLIFKPTATVTAIT